MLYNIICCMHKFDFVYNRKLGMNVSEITFYRKDLAPKNPYHDVSIYGTVTQQAV